MELEFIVGKCLAKPVADRYQSATETAVDLRTLAEKALALLALALLANEFESLALFAFHDLVIP